MQYKKPVWTVIKEAAGICTNTDSTFSMLEQNEEEINDKSDIAEASNPFFMNCDSMWGAQEDYY